MPFGRKRNETGNQFEGLLGQGERLNNEVNMADLMYHMDNSTKKHSRRGLGSQSSEEYQNVQSALRNVVFSTNGNFSNDVTTNEKMMIQAMGNYYKLLAACEAYIAKPGGFSMSGRARKNKVKEIQKYAQRDIMGIEQAFHAMKSMNGQQQSTLSWAEIFHSARMETIEVENYESLTSLGGQAKTGEDIGKLMKEGVFAPNKNFNFANASGANIADQTNTMVDEELNEKLKSQGMTTNMANRNVATSRVANLIGLGDLVAQSTLATVRDKATGQERKGSLMALAKGNEMQSEVNKNIRAKMLRVNDVTAREKMAKEMIAPTLQKELSSLQVLDYLCGQGDRHRGNYFATQKDGKYEHLQGIDNDLSFSTGVDSEKQLKNKKIGGGYLGGMNWRMVVDSNDNMTIPHMDQQLADNILKLKEDELRFVLKDLLEDVFIDQTIARLRKLQNAIKKEQEKTNSNVFVKDGGWNENTLNDFISQSTRHHLNKELEGKDLFTQRKFYYAENKNIYEYSKNESYVSVLIDDMIGYNVSSAYYSNFNDMINSYATSLHKKHIGKENIRKRLMEDYGLSKEELLSVPGIRSWIGHEEW